MLYTLWANTQVRPYTNYINTTTPPIRRIQKDLAEVRRIIAVGRRGKAPNDPRKLDATWFIDPLWVGLDESTTPVRPPARGGRSPLHHLYPLVVRSFAPPTGGYDSSDRKRSLPSSPALALLYDNGTSSDIPGRSSRTTHFTNALHAYQKQAQHKPTAHCDLQNYAIKLGNMRFQGLCHSFVRIISLHLPAQQYSASYDYGFCMVRLS